jgi:hypothetical protein
MSRHSELPASNVRVRSATVPAFRAAAIWPPRVYIKRPPPERCGPPWPKVSTRTLAGAMVAAIRGGRGQFRTRGLRVRPVRAPGEVPSNEEKQCCWAERGGGLVRPSFEMTQAGQIEAAAGAERAHAEPVSQGSRDVAANCLKVRPRATVRQDVEITTGEPPGQGHGVARLKLQLARPFTGIRGLGPATEGEESLLEQGSGVPVSRVRGGPFRVVRGLVPRPGGRPDSRWGHRRAAPVTSPEGPAPAPGVSRSGRQAQKGKEGLGPAARQLDGLSCLAPGLEARPGA